jgi:hypothetical protein
MSDKREEAFIKDWEALLEKHGAYFEVVEKGIDYCSDKQPIITIADDDDNGFLEFRLPE